MCATIHMYIDRLKDYQLPFKGSSECSGFSAHPLFGFTASELHTYDHTHKHTHKLKYVCTYNPIVKERVLKLEMMREQPDLAALCTYIYSLFCGFPVADKSKFLLKCAKWQSTNE